MKIAVRVAYPEKGKYNWHDALKELESVGLVEVAFYNYELFPRISLGSVQRPFALGLKLKISSIHAPHIRVTRWGLFEKTMHQCCEFAKALDAKYIVVHPTNARLNENMLNFLDYSIAPVLEEYGCVLCWETFLGGRRLFSGPKGIAEFCKNRPQFGMCYDTAHMAQETPAILEDFYNYRNIIRLFHISNWAKQGRQHLPLRHEDGMIDFKLLLGKLGRDFDGVATLEYLKKYHQHLVPDAEWANEFCH